jgi:hypothetical protein
MNAASAGFHSGPPISKDDTTDVEEEQNVEEPNSDAEEPHARLVSNVRVF